MSSSEYGGRMGKASRRKRERRAETHRVLQQVSSETGANVRLAQRSSRPKISGSLSELIRPYLDDDIGVEEYRTLVTMGALAWNLSARPEVGSSDRVQRLLEHAEISGGGDFRGFIEDLKIRKVRLFPDDQRFIVKTDVREQADGSFYLVAAAAAGTARVGASAKR